MTKLQKERRLAYRTRLLLESGYQWSLQQYAGLPPEPVLVRGSGDYRYALDRILAMNKYAFRTLLNR